MAAPPEVTRKIIEALLDDVLPQAKGRRLLLVFGRYGDSATEFGPNRSVRRRVHVADEHSVLGILEAWQKHAAAHAGDDDLLVITTSVDDSQLGWDVRGYAIKQSVRTVDKGRIVAQRFGAVDVDPRIRTEPWLIDALLDAEPPNGWPRNGTVLTRDAAVRALIGARLDRATPEEGALDAGALLEWSQDSAGPARFAALSEPERNGLTEWLAGAVGDVARVLLRLAADGRGADAMPLGVVGAGVARPGASPEAALAFGGLLGGVTGDELRTFSGAVESTLRRWVSEAAGEAERARVLDVLRRADELAAQARLTDALSGSQFLPSAFVARSRALAATLTVSPAGPTQPGINEAEAALDALGDHCLARLEPQRLRAAGMAVRLLRWLALPAESVESVAAGLHRHLSSWAWVDRALTTLWEGDATADPVTARAYRTVCEAVRAHRDALDETFAQRLATWTRHASAPDPGGALLIERVLAEVVVPLARSTAPLVVVLDGMSSAIAVDFGEQLAQSWIEVSPVAGRRIAAVATIPSVTQASRASLLAGTLTTGDQSTEREGFTALWQRHRRDAALFHKNDIPGEAGQRLSDELIAALSGNDVVAVVLNTIDYALDHGREGDRTRWTPRDITYLPELLDVARGYGRPVVLVSDHGHLLHRSGDTPPVSATGVESARWRTGTPEAGEIALTGPRVLYGGGSIVVPWREDIRYLPRRAGYHGGASLAEMTVPVLVLLPSTEQVPSGWHVVAGEELTPPWWHAAKPVTRPAVPKPRKAKEPEDAVPLFAVEQPPALLSLGARVVATEVYDGQRAFVPKAPDKQIVAAVIDALVEGDNDLSLSAVATVAGRTARGLEFFAATLQRLLNVDGYPVLSLVDGERRLKLDQETMRLQFGVRDQ